MLERVEFCRNGLTGEWDVAAEKAFRITLWVLRYGTPSSGGDDKKSSSCDPVGDAVKIQAITRTITVWM